MKMMVPARSWRADNGVLHHSYLHPLIEGDKYSTHAPWIGLDWMLCVAPAVQTPGDVMPRIAQGRLCKREAVRR
jgi:hypothetical protein